MKLPEEKHSVHELMRGMSVNSTTASKLIDADEYLTPRETTETSRMTIDSTVKFFLQSFHNFINFKIHISSFFFM